MRAVELSRGTRHVQLRCGPLHLVLMLSLLRGTGRWAPWDWVWGPCPKLRVGPLVACWWRWDR